MKQMRAKFWIAILVALSLRSAKQHSNEIKKILTHSRCKSSVESAPFNKHNQTILKHNVKYRSPARKLRANNIVVAKRRQASTTFAGRAKNQFGKTRTATLLGSYFRHRRDPDKESVPFRRRYKRNRLHHQVRHRIVRLQRQKTAHKQRQRVNRFAKLIKNKAKLPGTPIIGLKRANTPVNHI